MCSDVAEAELCGSETGWKALRSALRASWDSAGAAEAWCVGELSVAPGRIGEEQPFWVRLEVRAENPAEEAELDRQESVSLTRLIEIFGRRGRGEQSRWVAEAGPVELAELRKAATGVRP